MRIEIIRHGRTMLQEEHRYVGHTDDPLSPAGAHELEAATHIPAHVYVTSLQRTRQTAELIFPGACLIEVPGLEEMDFGTAEGHTHQEMMEQDADYRAWVENGCMGRCPGGESRDEFSTRVCEAFARLVREAQSQGTDVLTIVAHGGTIMAVMDCFGIPRREFFSWQTKHGCGLMLDDSAWEREHTLRLVSKTDHRRKDSQQ